MPETIDPDLVEDIWDVFGEYFGSMTPERVKLDEGLKEELVKAMEEKFREHGFVHKEELPTDLYGTQAR